MAGRSLVAVALLFCVAASLFVTFAEAACPGNCNNHGRCNPNNLCDCDDGWVGPQCTLTAKALNPGSPISNEIVATRSWNYYFTKEWSNHGSNNQQYVWWVNTTGSGDIDIFVQKDRLPTRTDYLARNITTMRYFTVTAPRSGSGTFYIGIFSFSGRGTSYNIGLLSESECPKACSGHGTCQSGVCVCHPDFTGPACDNGIKMLTINRPVADSVKAGNWKYYRIHAIVENTLRIIVNQTSSTGSVDLYAKFNKIPTLTDYDISEQTLAKNFYMDIQLERSTFGYWNLGIYGLSDCSFSIKYQQYNDCPNDCSSHGTCATNGCRCNSGFVGSYCETMVAELADGEIIKGFVGDNTWNWYTYTPHSTTEMLISVNQTGSGGGDCDVYVRKGFKPTLANWDARNISLAQKMTVRVPEPEFTIWHIGVFGFRACTYLISASSTNKCTQCGPHGQCGAQEGVCICDAGWTGQTCDIQIQAITNFSAPIMGNLAQGQWNYYSIQGVPNREVTVHMIELQTVGYFWLFLNQKTIPTLTNFNSTLSDKESNTNTHQVRTDTTNNDIWYIGVYGSPFSADDKKSYPYELQAWESPF